MKNTAILLATYNGERYLCELLESLYHQTCKDFTLYVHDDCSSDRTLEIIRSFQDRLSIEIMDDPEPGRGACKSFLWMLEHVDAQYYFFCDQDDVWLPEKVEKSLNDLTSLEKNSGKTIPYTVFCDLKVVDSELNTISESFWRSECIFPDLLSTFSHLAAQNAAAGCSMCFNRAARDLAVPAIQHPMMHDHCVMLLTVANHGKIKPLYEPLILYRQHGSNVLGANEYQFKLGEWLSRNVLFFSKAGRERRKKNWDLNMALFRQANEIKKISKLKFLFVAYMWLRVRRAFRWLKSKRGSIVNV